MDEEGQDFVLAFGQAFGNVANTDRRVKAERRAGMTSKQRARRAKKAATINFRCSDATRKIVEDLAAKFGSNFTDVMERAVAMLATSERIGPDA
jgi:hypothetical protein